MVDMQWKLGMAVSSDTCRSLNSPYVSLLLKVADASGEVTYKSFEMSVPQFQVCVCVCVEGKHLPVIYLFIYPLMSFKKNATVVT